MRSRKIAVIGAGNGGRAFAAYLASQGHEVVLFNRTLARIKHIAEAKQIISEGEVEGSFPLQDVTDDYRSAITHACLILVVLPASAHAEVAAKMAPDLQDGQIILLNPGRTWGAIEAKNVIKKMRPDLDVYVGETQTLLFTCREIEDSGVKIFKIKDDNPFCFFPEQDNRFVDYFITELFPTMSVVDDIKVTSLTNIGAIIHPTAVVLNAGSIARQQKFLFYREGLTQEVVNIIEKVDQERCKVAEQLDMRPDSFLEWAKKAYGGEFTTYYDAFQNIEPYRDIGSPSTLFSRYITEDVPTGLVPFASMGRYFGIPTPFIDSIILMASSLVGTDFMETGRTNENVALPIEILEGGGANIRVGRAFPGQESSIIRVLTRIQEDLHNSWLLVKGRPERVNMIKRCLFASMGVAPTRSMLHEHVYIKETEKQEMEIVTVKKTDMLREALGLKALERRLFGFEIKDVAQGDDFRVQPLISYGEFISDVSMHIKKLRAELQEITRDGSYTRT
ncbi:MAG: NAD/NADP octopine/nopaline dehydrogenase family protein [Candidatus Lokiarchaeota archaeon]|nr:NAD/NADP octopine/nopaline dehydrogenase family protein [Candidatus Lokiarchaeota archaeon]